MSKIGRNEDCPCGSGKKYKKCGDHYGMSREDILGTVSIQEAHSHVKTIFDKKSDKETVVMMPYKEGFAHVSRCLAVANELKDKYRVVFYYKGGIEELTQSEGFEILTKEDIQIKFTARAVNVGKSRGGTGSIEDILRDTAELDFDAIKALNAVALVSDTSVIANIYGRKLGIPHIAIVNALDAEYVVSEKEPFNEDMESCQRTCQALGLPIPQTCSELFRGDITLVVEDEFYLPEVALPSHARLTGPILWRHKEKNPPINKNGRKLVVVSFGGTGNEKTFQTVCGMLSSGTEYKERFAPDVDVRDYEIIANASFIPQGEHGRRHGRVTFYRFLNLDQALQEADYLVSQGSNITNYRAIIAGVPSIIIPSNLDHTWNGERMVELGLGKIISSSELTLARLHTELQSLDELRPNFARYRGLVTTNGAQRAAEVIHSAIQEYKARR